MLEMSADCFAINRPGCAPHPDRSSPRIRKFCGKPKDRGKGGAQFMVTLARKVPFVMVEGFPVRPRGSRASSVPASPVST